MTTMPMRLSGRQLNKLGDRLASADSLTDDDYSLLAQVAEDYQAVLDKVEEKLQGLGYQATTRVKTTGTLVDKLRRSPHLRLKAVHDVAGARIVIDGGRWEQDQVVNNIVQRFEKCPKPPECVDRRKSPSHGYRACHIVVYEDGVPVEIQVRTKLQDKWAQITEKLGDAWGRGIRYGLGPDQPDRLVVLPGDEDSSDPHTRAQVVELMGNLANLIDMLETAQFKIDSVRAPLAGYEEDARVLMDRLIAAFSALGSSE